MKRNKVIDAEFFYGATPEIFLRAGVLRKNMTGAEKVLWKEISNKKISGLTFRRQHPVNMFIADFYCHKARLAIEIDGSIHSIEEHRIHDLGREDEFAKFDIATIRFTNEDVFEKLDMVVAQIRKVCESRVSPQIKPK